MSHSTVPTHPRATSELRRELAGLMPILSARALRLCRSETEAQDVLHDTVVRALEFEHGYHAGTNLRAWVNQVLFSVFVTRCRRLRRERRALDVLATDPCAWTRSDGAPAMRALTSPVRRALDALPPQFSAVIELVDLGELSYKDAADVLGVPVGTVMSRLFRGRRLLAAALCETLPSEQQAPEQREAA